MPGSINHTRRALPYMPSILSKKPRRVVLSRVGPQISHSGLHLSLPLNEFLDKEQVSKQSAEEQTRLQQEGVDIKSLLKLSFSVGALATLSATFRTCSQGTRFELDRERLRRLARLSDDLPNYLGESA